MTPEYLEELADIADPDKLWRLGWQAQKALPPEKKAQMDTGMALRRYADDERTMARALAKKESVLWTPLASNASAMMNVPTPPEHERLRPKLDY